MTTEELILLPNYFQQYTEDELGGYFTHHEHDYFKIIIGRDSEVYQLNTDHEPYGVELKSMDELRKRFESFVGEKLEDLSYTLKWRLEELNDIKKDIEILSQELENAHLYLDEKKISRYNAEDITDINKRPIVDRIKEFTQTYEHTRQNS
jgi:regulator of replication initiation timing